MSFKTLLQSPVTQFYSTDTPYEYGCWSFGYINAIHCFEQVCALVTTIFTLFHAFVLCRWQRSKSSVYDYGSDLYCDEDIKTGACFLAEQRRRRASVEAIVQSAKPESTTACQPTVPVGPPIQKRMLTVKQGANDRSLQKVQIIEREGPKARAYTPRYESANAYPHTFPYAESEPDAKTYECKQRFMEMLVYTDSFDWRSGAAEPEGMGYETGDDSPYPVNSYFPVKESSPLYKYVNAMRIELKEAEVPPDRVVHGRVFFNLKEPVTVEAVGIDINKTLAMTMPDGKVIIPSRDKNYAPELKLLPNRQPRLLLPGMEPQPGDSTAANRLPNDFALVEAIPKKAILQSGYSAIPFKIYVPENQVPTFTYTCNKGSSVFNNYSVEASVRMNGNVVKSERVPIVVPALGKKNDDYAESDDNYDLVITNRQFTKDDGFDFAVGYTEKDSGHDKPKKVTASVIRKAKCPAIGLDDETRYSVTDHASVSSSSSNPVLEKYQQNTGNKTLKTDWDANAYSENNLVPFTTPTVSAGGFTCDYLLELHVDDETYRTPVLLVNRYDDKASNRSDISSLSKRKDFKVTA
ncbi:unnamed protein product [Hydatigera taeniaeformis]|uniref:Arrestin_C domain-containing protein n=1 Tax=Hydatigena taeniaeformis TaxID=6205 RepID=A0A158RE01_HYDTA|nr:unnamed protein product [Hydatigera taeniaeformis]